MDEPQMLARDFDAIVGECAEPANISKLGRRTSIGGAHRTRFAMIVESQL